MIKYEITLPLLGLFSEQEHNQPNNNILETFVIFTLNTHCYMPQENYQHVMDVKNTF